MISQYQVDLILHQVYFLSLFLPRQFHSVSSLHHLKITVLYSFFSCVHFGKIFLNSVNHWHLSSGLSKWSNIFFVNFFISMWIVAEKFNPLFFDSIQKADSISMSRHNFIFSFIAHHFSWVQGSSNVFFFLSFLFSQSIIFYLELNILLHTCIITCNAAVFIFIRTNVLLKRSLVKPILFSEISFYSHPCIKSPAYLNLLICPYSVFKNLWDRLLILLILTFS